MLAIKFIAAAVLVAVISSACTTAPPEAAPATETYTIGTVTVTSNGETYEPAAYMLHSAVRDDRSGGLLSASAVPFEWWMEKNLDKIPVIQSAGGFRVTVDRQDGRIGSYARAAPASYDGMPIVGLRAEQFADGTADVPLPDLPDRCFVYVDVRWTADGAEFTNYRYFFILDMTQTGDS